MLFKKSLTLLLTLLMCFTILGVNTNVTKAEDEEETSNEPLTQEVSEVTNNDEEEEIINTISIKEDLIDINDEINNEITLSFEIEDEEIQEYTYIWSFYDESDTIINEVKHEHIPNKLDTLTITLDEETLNYKYLQVKVIGETNNSELLSSKVSINITGSTQQDIINEEIKEENNNEFIINPEPESEGNDDEAHGLGYIDDTSIDTSLFNHQPTKGLLKASSIPASYSLKDKGLITSVKDQGNYGTCWAFAAVASAESNYLKRTGNILDLSELHLGWFGYVSYQKEDPLKLVTNDGAYVSSVNETLQFGGNQYMATLILASGIGFNKEIDFPYDTAENYTSYKYKDTNCYDSDFLLDSVKWINMSERNNVKQAILDYGAVTSDFLWDGSCYNLTNSSFCQRYTTSTNHAITIVGWDDNYSRKNFNLSYRPSYDGAWLVKNSWGDDWGNNGYLWISYYDTGIANATATSFSVSPNNGTTSIYQYDGGLSTAYGDFGNTLYEANIYTAQKNEYLTKVGIVNMKPNTNYEIKIYKGVGSSPTSGTLVSTTTGTSKYAGYEAIDLNKYVKLEKNTKYSVVVKRYNSSGVYAFVDYYGSVQNSDGYTLYFESSLTKGQSFYTTNGSTWNDYYDDDACARIKALTDTNIYLTCTNNSPVISIGETVTLDVDTTLDNLTYSSNNTNVATVNANGVVKGIGKGTATITISSKGISTTATVTVEGKNAPEYTVSLSDEGILSISSTDADYINAICNSSTTNKITVSNGTKSYSFNTSKLTKKSDTELLINSFKEIPVATYTSLTIEADGYRNSSKTINITTKLAAPECTFQNVTDGLKITGNSTYINSINSIFLVGHETINLFDSTSITESGTILITHAKLFEVIEESGTYEVDIIISSEKYYSKIKKDFTLTISDLDLPNINTTVNLDNSITITSNKNWLDKLSDSSTEGSRIKFKFKDEIYEYPVESLTRNSNTQITLSSNSISSLLPGINGRKYDIVFNSHTYKTYTYNNYETKNLTAKTTDKVYLTFKFTNEVVISGTRGSVANIPTAPTIQYKHFDHWEDEDGNTILSDGKIPTTGGDLDVYPIYDFDTYLENVESNPSPGEVVNGTKIILSTPITQDSKIYYTLDNTKPTTNSLVFSGNIVIDESLLIDGKVYVKAFATKENCGDGNISTFTYTIKENTDDWGDIEVQDRAGFSDASKVYKGIWTAGIKDVDYDPSIKSFVQDDYRVYANKTKLVEGTDYTVKYSNNSKVGTATITINGKGNYTGSVSKTFDINARALDDVNFEVVLATDCFKYTSKEIKPSITVKLKNSTIKLKANTDYTVKLSDSIGPINSGTITITGVGNYKDTLTTLYTITNDKTLISTATISKINNREFNGTPYKPEPTISIKVGKVTTNLKYNDDYELNYDNDTTSVGTHVLTIKGKGKYIGTVTKTYNITGISASKLTVTGIEKSYIYDKAGVKPTPTVEYKANKNSDFIKLEEGTHYSVEYLNNDKVGTATLIIKGLESGGYTGTKKVTYKITGKPVSDLNIAEITDQTYLKGGAKPEVSIKYRDYELVLNKDYTVKYANNTKVGQGKVTIAGKGNFTGSVTKYFNITQSSLDNVEIVVNDKVYANKKDNYIQSIKVIDSDGKELKAGTDYNKTITYTYENDNPITKGTIVQVGTIIKCEIVGIGNYSGEKSETYRIVTADVSKASATIINQYYTGKEIELKGNQITVKVGKEILTADDYEITSYSNNISVGTASVTIEGKGKYGGTKAFNFKILSKPIQTTIIFNANGGSSSMKNITVTDTTSTSLLTKNAFSRKDYIFDGWCTRPDGSGIKYDDQASISSLNMEDGDVMILYATWKKAN